MNVDSVTRSLLSLVIVFAMAGCAADPAAVSTQKAGEAAAEEESSDEKEAPKVTVAPTGPPSALDENRAACISHISADATPGQRMLAEKSCQQHKK